MRSTLLLLALLTPTFAHAQNWIDVAGNDTYRVYVDAQSIKEKGFAVSSWTLNDYVEKDADGVRSYINFKRYQCDDEMSGTLNRALYSETMGQGRVIASGSNPNFEMRPMAPGSVGRAEVKFVCAYASGEEWALQMVSIQSAQRAHDTAAAAADAAGAADSHHGP